MTKVILSPLLLEYRDAMAELVNRVREKVTIAGMDRQSVYWPDPAPKDVRPPSLVGLLKAPMIELLWADISLLGGQLDGIIQVNTVDDFGIINVYVTLRDDRGNLIEGGYAMKNEIVEDHWFYVPSVFVPSGTSVIVQAVASDALGGVAIQTEKVTV
jgi:hypothetical protein